MFIEIFYMHAGVPLDFPGMGFSNGKIFTAAKRPPF